MSNDSTDYPDIEADTLGDLKKFERLPGMKDRPPKIQWGHVYKSWTLTKQLEFAEDLANTMNHAADVLQQERNQLVDLVKTQEAKIKELVGSYQKQGEVVAHEITVANAQRQETNELIVALTSENKSLKRQIKRLESNDGSLDR